MAPSLLAGKTAWVIGASGAIGSEIARGLARRQFNLALLGRNEGRLNELANELRPAYCQTFICDITSLESVTRVHDQMMKRLGFPDIVIFACGRGDRMDSFQFSGRRFEETVQVNLIGIGYWLEFILPDMIRRRQGTIVGISSLAAGRGLPGGIVYCPSKAGLSNLFECLRIDLKHFGINAILVEPGFVASPMTERLPFTPFMVDPETAAEIILRGIEQGRLLIRFPWTMRVYAYLMRILPRWIFDRIMDRYIRLGGRSLL